MENASKALLIAGAILLAIIIISLGIIVVRNSQDTINNANTNQQEIEAFNNKFEAYTSGTLTATKLKSLFSTIITSNAANPENIVKVKYSDNVLAAGVSSVEEEPKTIPSIDSGKKFNVTATYNTKGYINLLTITN